MDFEDGPVNYEAFDAKEDGVADDMPAICKAHQYANEHGLKVQDKMGPGGFFLAAKMSRELKLGRDCRIINLACGSGTTSVFLAKLFDAQVFAINLWVKP